MAATAGEKDHSSNRPTNTRLIASAPCLSASGGIRKSTGPPPAHRVQAIYDQKIAALEEENNHLRNWWWVDMMDRLKKRDCGQDDRRSEIYRREHWLRGLALAADGWVEADFAREKMLRADMREKEKEAKMAKEEAEKARLDLVAAQVELAAVKRELEEKKEQSAIDRQLAMALLAAAQ